MPDYRRYPNEGFPYLVTTKVKDRQPLFAQRACCEIVIASIVYLRTHLGHRVYAYVVMPNHVHLVVTPRTNANVSQVMHSFKLYTARRIGVLLGSQGGMWQARFYERSHRNPTDVESALEYVHSNPVRAGLVDRPEDCQWSSYRACVLGDPIPMDVDPLA